MSGQRQINVRVDEATAAGIEARAKAAGMSVPDYARQVLADEANDLRHRFLGAGAHFADAWGDTFAEQFGHPKAGGGAGAAA
ncbi:ribbon-helix-helix protein, CopG family [Streptomyces adustus]|uniref:Ribbon-helix-helix protein, CopG family n=1 Tax=Streptomyces adustus TaxID=1609272 RepID=A0A5N8V9K1_9ACTN|nr:ribbon-helix-helix protein, CopG family [Streptomyces adustus]MPY30744.1 ribbon-helix-helix protein, CopG family [Streptomyces adustus]